MGKSRKLTFTDEIQPVLKPESIEAKEEFEETAESIKKCGTPGDIAYPSVFETPVETPAVEIEDPEPGLEPEEIVKLEDAGERHKEALEMLAKDAPTQKCDIKAELTKILKPNLNQDMPKTRVIYRAGLETNYLILEVQGEFAEKAWMLYQKEVGKAPGKFVELVCEILNTPNGRYWHKVSDLDLDAETL